MRFVLILKEMGIPASVFPITFDSLVNRARNAATAYFLSDPEHTHMLFIDSDIEFKVKDILTLIEADKDVIGIGYAQKWLNEDKLTSIFGQKEKPVDYLELCTNASVHLIQENKDQGIIQEVEYCTTGCLLIKRSVIEHMIKHYPERKYKNDVDGYMGCNEDKFYNLFSVEIHPDTRRLESEDYAFCRLWRQLNGKIHVLLDASVKHWGWFGYPNNLNRQIEFFNKNRMV